MRNSTIGKQMGFLKWFLRWSFKKGHHQNIAYDAFKPKLKTTPKKVIFLTWDELNKLKIIRYRMTSSIWNVSGMSFCSVALRAYDIRMSVILKEVI